MRGEVANTVEEALSDDGVTSIGMALRGESPVYANAIHGLTLRLSQQQTDAQWEHIGASLQACRIKAVPARTPSGENPQRESTAKPPAG